MSHELISTGRSYNDINEEIYYLSIFMASLIAILICMALCYIAYEKYHKKREYFINV